MILMFIIQNVHTQKIYGPVDNHFCSFDINTQGVETLFTFEANIAVNLDFHAAFDRFNGRYFLGANIPGRNGRFHIIDVNTKEIESFGFFIGDIEYDCYRNRLVYESNGKFYTLNLNTKIVQKLSDIENQNSKLYGHMRTYVPQKFEYIYRDPLNTTNKYYNIAIDSYSGTLKCKEENEHNIQGLQCNYYDNTIICHKEGHIGLMDLCNNLISFIVKVPDYTSHLNNQMCIYDHNTSNYIIPYIGSSTKYVFVNINKRTIEREIQQPFLGNMNLQQIYDKPNPIMICYNDTLFVPKGNYYVWYRNDSVIGSSNENYWVPKETGNYVCEIVFQAYTAFSNSKFVKVNAVKALDLKREPLEVNIDLSSDHIIFISSDKYLGKSIKIRFFSIDGKLLIEINTRIDNKIQKIPYVFNFSGVAYSQIEIESSSFFGRKHFIF